jgi:hypothetical protein
VADLNEPAEQQPGEPLPRRGAPLSSAGLPVRRPVPDAEQLTDRPQRDEPITGPAEPLPRRGGRTDTAPPLPSRLGPTSGAQPLPRRSGSFDDAQSLPSRLGSADSAQPLPRRSGSFDDAQPLPSRLGSADDARPLPSRLGPTSGAQPLPSRLGSTDDAQPLPSRLGSTDDAQPLPRRTRSRPPGRHRSPHRLSVASDAPALVLAVPGSAAADTAGIGPAVAATAELSCPGVDIRIGYLEGDEAALADCLATDDESAEADQFPSVIVPLLLSPSLRLDPAIRRLTGDSPTPAVLAAHLGPHPLVAEALHSRLAEAGLVRHSRASGLSISADGRGIVVLADIGEEATSAAAVAAVLLASRLSVPVVPASLGDPASIVTAVDRLTESGAGRPALAPCLIGPETSIAVLDDLSAALGAPCAPAIGAHQAIGQLVAIRYGAALAGLSLAG